MNTRACGASFELVLVGRSEFDIRTEHTSIGDKKAPNREVEENMRESMRLHTVRCLAYFSDIS